MVWSKRSRPDTPTAFKISSEQVRRCNYCFGITISDEIFQTLLDSLLSESPLTLAILAKNSEYALVPSKFYLWTKEHLILKVSLLSKELIEKGANVNWSNAKGSTPLHLSCNNADMKVFTALLAKGTSETDRQTDLMERKRLAYWKHKRNNEKEWEAIHWSFLKALTSTRLTLLVTLRCISQLPPTQKTARWFESFLREVFTWTHRQTRGTLRCTTLPHMRTQRSLVRDTERAREKGNSHDWFVLLC